MMIPLPKYLAYSLFALVLFANSAASQAKITPVPSFNLTIKQAKLLREDSVITIQGYVVQSINSEQYLFRTPDSDETMVMEVESSIWKGQTVTPIDLIQVVGEIDKEASQLLIEADYLKIVETPGSTF